MSILPNCMKISVLAKPGSKKDGVEENGDGVWVVRVRVRAADGKANDAIREVLADHFGCRAREVEIISGFKSHHKIVEIPNNLLQ